MFDEPNDSPKPKRENDVYPVGEPDPDVEVGEPLVPVDPDRISDTGGPREGPFQFSLAELLVTVALVAFVLGILGIFPRQYAAGLAGLGVLISLLVISVLQPTRPIVMITWWALFLVYLIMSVLAVMNSGSGK